MKKRNMKLPKRLLSMSLALSMCVGMACTTAFADDAEDYVYVYVGVDVVDTTEPETPDFSFKVTEEQKQELEELHNNVLNGGETADRAFEEIPESKHEFDAKDALQEAVNKAIDGLILLTRAPLSPSIPPMFLRRRSLLKAPNPLRQKNPRMLIR